MAFSTTPLPLPAPAPAAPSMPPLDKSKTIRHRSIGRRPAQIAEATSADGAWVYVHVELPGTPWDVLHVETQTVHHGFGTLAAARRWAACDHCTAKAIGVAA